ncbi:unnamed protein product [Heterobilharzia americana]|nr:unnamed protein product [Heterobilharzia americana]
MITPVKAIKTISIGLVLLSILKAGLISILQKSIYQCVKFEPVNELDTVTVFNLLLSKYTSSTPDSTLCYPNTFMPTISRWITIPVLNSDLRKNSKLCPISGGFQISQTYDLKNEKVLCESDIYGTMESECISGEGISWTFPQPKCNPFDENYKIQFQCHSTWKSHNLNYVLMYTEVNQFTYKFYQLVYVQLPVELSTESITYERLSPVWIIYGLQSDEKVEKVINNRIYMWDLVEKYLPESRKMTPFNTLVNAYEMKIRRAFGNCDDERVICKYGCEHSAKNQFFCHRSCLVPGQICGSLLHDSCKFHSNYHGKWDLIESNTIKELTTYAHSTSRLVTQFLITDDKLVIYSVNDVAYSIRFYCIREIQESLVDRYIIRTSHQLNGCHSKDLCLEIYRGNKKVFEESSSVNSIMYRMSIGGKRLLTDPCQFNTDNQIPGRTIYPVKANVLLRNTNQKNYTYTTTATKCGLYQILLTGTIYIWYPESMKYSDQSERFITTSKETANYLQRKQNYSNTSTHINSNSMIPDNSERNTTYQGPCPVEISDFNPHIGMSGEFDNVLRIRHYCETKIYPSIFKSDHQLSYLSIITYLKITGQYYCLIIKSYRDGNINNYIIFMYHSPQCQYESTPFENIKVDESKAFGKLILTSLFIVDTYQFKDDDPNV